MCNDTTRQLRHIETCRMNIINKPSAYFHSASNIKKQKETSLCDAFLAKVGKCPGVVLSAFSGITKAIGLQNHACIQWWNNHNAFDETIWTMRWIHQARSNGYKWSITQTIRSWDLKKQTVLYIGEGPSSRTFWIFDPNPWPIGLGWNLKSGRSYYQGLLL